MNKTEVKAYSWLISQNKTKDQLHFQSRKNPDFILPDGRGFEIKRIVGKAIWFGFDQFQELKKMGEKITILAFSDETNNPVVISMKDIEDQNWVNGIRIIVEPKRVSVSFDDDIMEGITKYRITHAPIPNFTKAVNDLLRENLKERKML